MLVKTQKKNRRELRRTEDGAELNKVHTHGEDA